METMTLDIFEKSPFNFRHVTKCVKFSHLLVESSNSKFRVKNITFFFKMDQVDISNFTGNSRPWIQRDLLLEEIVTRGSFLVHSL